MRRFTAALAAASLLAITSTSIPATAQVPPGMNAQSMIGGPISVPAGETTTVDLGVPVSASYSGGGWQVTSSGTSVTVTAPASGSASVPVSAMGQSATITLIAEEGATVPEDVQPAPGQQAPGSDAGSGGGSGAPAQGQEQPGQPSQGQQGQSGAGQSNKVVTPPNENRKPAPEVNRAEAEQIRLDAKIDGNKIVAKLGLVQAANLYNKFGNQSQDGVKLRYMDVNGRLIEGVKREINKEARTLTLTYPEGQTPDNPFVMEAVRDGNSIAVVTLTDPSLPEAAPADPATSPVQPATEDPNSNKKIGLMIGAGVLALLVVVGGISALFGKLRR